MFGSNKKSWTDRLKDKANNYIDKRLEDYRGQLSLDIAKGLGSLAGLIAIWTVFIICVLFLGIAIAHIMAWFLSGIFGTFALPFSYLMVALLMVGLAFLVFIYREPYIEKPVYKATAEALRIPKLSSDKKAELEELASKETRTEKKTLKDPIIPPEDEKKDTE